MDPAPQPAGSRADLARVGGARADAPGRHDRRDRGAPVRQPRHRAHARLRDPQEAPGLEPQGGRGAARPQERLVVFVAVPVGLCRPARSLVSTRAIPRSRDVSICGNWPSSRRGQRSEGA